MAIHVDEGPHLERNTFILETRAYGSSDPWLPSGSVHPDVRQGISRKEVLGFNTVDYFERRKAGELLPFTDWKQWTILSECDGHLNFIHPPWGEFRWTGVGPYMRLGGLFRDWLVWKELLPWTFMRERNLTTQVYVQVAAAKLYESGWDSLTFVAELHKTVRLFEKLLEKFFKLFSNPRELYKAWLEARYGWRLLKYDIEDIQKAIKSLDEEQRVRVKKRVGDDFHNVTMETLSASGSIATYEVDLTIEQELSLRGTVIADFLPPKVRANLITTAWELVPFSFVVDWFFTVGSALSAALLQLSYKTVSAGGVKWRSTMELSNARVTWASGWSGDYKQTGICACHGVWRAPQSIPIHPQFNLRLDQYKILDLLALLRGFFGR